MFCLPILLTMSFREEKFSLSIISVMDHAFGVACKMSLPWLKSSRDFPMLYSRSFIVLCFTIRSVAHFEVMFVKGIKSVPEFIFFFLHIHVQVFQHCMLKRLMISSDYTYVTLFFLSSQSILITYLTILSPVPHCLYHCSFRVNNDIK